MENYIEVISSLSKPSFQEIRQIANDSISHVTRSERDRLWKELKRGTALLNSHEHMCQYLWSFGNMHQAKLMDAYKQLPRDIFENGFEIVDWGCGQGLGTINLFDYLENQGITNYVKGVTLIEPSEKALERAILHTQAYIDSSFVTGYSEFFENITPEQIKSKLGLPVIHIFSNILDVAQIDLKHLANLIDASVVSDNYIVSVGPLNPTNKRIDAFYNYFDVPLIYNQEDSFFKNRKWTYKCKIYKLEYNEQGHLIPIEFYPSVQFHAAYELDIIKSARRASKMESLNSLTHFETTAPFDIGASVYDDVHPILAVLNNIITRGLPTKSSIYIEEVFSKSFGLSKKHVVRGEIGYITDEEIDYAHLVERFSSLLDNDSEVVDEDLEILQHLLSPIAIARFQKLVIEALITGHLELEKEEWHILVEENDVPFAAIALKDLEQTFNHLTQLSTAYDTLKFPKVNLDILSNPTFNKSPLHLDYKVLIEPKSIHYSKQYDMVVNLAMLKSKDLESKGFSKFNCLNNCYFNIRTIEQKKTDRTIYTSSLINYKNLVSKTDLGVYIENELQKSDLTYFLQLFFRKESFRPGQLPILDRALQNLPVIGLLPTGGGKSLTYQIAALLQPGVTLIIDPLKSLMKDQYDGLINSGIDVATYLNSSLTKKEREFREKQLESSEMLFTFVSPERLSILKFRERLKNMHNYNVYFSYGVIDEVHCVSEWGHDFRFSYLHLGRNLYNYVKAKENEISLFGLTATASFDVLADVERELSGNGAFYLDSEVIVRYENTNRLELQYKVEKVEAEFEEDKFFDKAKVLAPHLPRAINITNNRAVFDSKSKFLKKYITKVPDYIKELQLDENISLIKNRFKERQNNDDNLDNDLTVEMPLDYYAKKENYNEAGIVFCPHVNSTGISVSKNKESLGRLIPDLGSFTGKDTDESSMENLELFRDNKQPLMVATKAFGMGIDKPNVRYTVNMNYSSSLESFVQEAGRAGRDRKMALSVILFSDYDIVKIKSNYTGVEFPIGTLRNRWFKTKDLKRILDFYNIKVPEEFLEYANPSKDLVKLHCKQDNRMFAFGNCNEECNLFRSCTLKNANQDSKGWHTESELNVKLHEQGLKLGKKHFQYLSADFQSVMYFFNESFKGDIVEKTFMHQLLNVSEVYVYNKQSKVRETKTGFLSSILEAEINGSVVVYVPYTEDNVTDINKAIYRLCCIELIEDFTQDYTINQFRIVAIRRKKSEYFKGLLNFLLKYFTRDRALLELKKAKTIPIKGGVGNEITQEIYQCLAYLTEFVYDKISEKRKRAIDDMRNFCLEGVSEEKSWVERNEELKDYIYYYFNSKYAKTDYIADNGEPYSLVNDTDGGKVSSPEILFKYLKVIEEDLVGVGTPNDNIKHLQGAVRLISRSLTDTNPALALLEAFTIIYLGTNNNEILEKQLALRYLDGMEEMFKRIDSAKKFWRLFKKYNKLISVYMDASKYSSLVDEAKLIIHSHELNKITFNYLETYE
ncbi:DEAD/DEAH box helicase [Aequorivita sinensis]|uniref:DEAD/DEAH box helicase n=1 Tax=Aequorivita sinensis TaxID=1382458 RepID=UPI00111F4F68|nr:DEAD/DEAH box helicase [Aequorivita sinensis]